MSVFVLLERLLADPTLAKARRLLKRRLETLGLLRDLQVQLPHLERKLGAFPEVLGVCHALKERERFAMKGVGREVRGGSKKLEKWMAAVEENLATLARRDSSHPFADEFLERFLRQLEQQLPRSVQAFAQGVDILFMF